MKVSTRALLLVGIVFLVGTVFGGLVGARIALRQLGTGPSVGIEDPGQFSGDPGVRPPLASPGTRLGRPPGEGRSRPGQRPQSGQRSQNGLGRMIRHLELDEDQTSQVREILQSSRKKQMAVNEHHQSRSGKIRQESLEEIQGVLKPEQAERFQRMLERLNQSQRRGRERRPF